MLTKRYFKTRPEVEVTFAIARPEAAIAEWVSEATGWEPVPMKRSGPGGDFKLKVRLPRDADVEFRYRFDGGDWDNDEAADDYRPTGFGVYNSVVSTA